MNPPPVPFGDPAQIQQQRSAAVRKGIAFGCGGCALLMLAALVFFGGMFLVAMTIIRNTGPVQATLQAARASAALTEALGEPIELGWFISGNVESEDDRTQADVTVPLAGPRGRASVHTVGTRSGRAGWQFSTMSATVEQTGATIDLRPPPGG